MKIVAGIGLAVLLVVTYWLLSVNGAIELFTNGAALRDYITELGLLGPAAVIGLMTIAIVLSPIPSAPIAIAAGAAYGHVWGTIYVLVGAELGALIAFTTARLLGYEALVKRFGKKNMSFRLMDNQNTLMWVVFVTRLLPFISFDLVSYAVGLTPLAAWRFAIATLAGIIPASFILAHFGEEMTTADPKLIMMAATLLGGVTAVPLVIKYVISRQQK